MSLYVNCETRTLTLQGRAYPCRIGKRGCVDGDLGREGDHMTPLGDYTLRFGLYRADRLPPPRSSLTFRALRPDDGWCDDSQSPAYNRFVRLPCEQSHEKLWREDGAYDVVLVISHNDSPPIPALGSAVFVHIAQPDDRQTLGCVAVTPDVMANLIPNLKPDMRVIIER